MNSRFDKARRFKRRYMDRMDALKIVAQKVIRIDELSEDELLEIMDIYDEYEVDKTYVEGDLFLYQGSLYKVLQPHTSQEDWKPNELPALYLNKLPDNVIPEWKTPTGQHDAYNKGDKVIYGGKVYTSLIDNNTWSPGDYPAGWEKE